MGNGKRFSSAVTVHERNEKPLRVPQEVGETGRLSRSMQEIPKEEYLNRKERRELQARVLPLLPYHKSLVRHARR